MGIKETLEKVRWRKDNLVEIRKERKEKTKLAREALRRLALY